MAILYKFFPIYFFQLLYYFHYPLILYHILVLPFQLIKIGNYNKINYVEHLFILLNNFTGILSNQSNLKS